MTKDSYKLLNYSLPPEAPEVYARQAISILKQLKEKLPAFYPKFIAPSEVLTLSGVRAFDTYYDLGKDAVPQQIVDLKKLLRQHNILYVEERLPIAGNFDEENQYSLVHLDALADVPNRYHKAPGWYAFDVAHYGDAADFFIWWLCWKDRINSMSYGEMAESPLPKHWVDRWSVGHDISFGILLGYPGEAICSSTDIELKYRASGLETPLSNADIAHMTEYDGAWPQYQFATSLENDPSIVAHQKLWSDILNQVYAELEL